MTEESTWLQKQSICTSLPPRVSCRWVGAVPDANQHGQHPLLRHRLQRVQLSSSSLHWAAPSKQLGKLVISQPHAPFPPHGSKKGSAGQSRLLDHLQILMETKRASDQLWLPVISPRSTTSKVDVLPLDGHRGRVLCLANVKLQERAP